MEKTKLTAVLVAVIFGALSFLGLGAAAVLAGSVMGATATLNSLPNKCKAPFNIFDAWDSFEGYLAGNDCSCPAPPTAGNGGTFTGTGNVSAAKIDYVENIIGVGNAMRIPSQGIIIAITVADVESNIQNYANDGVYDILRNPADATLGSAQAAAPILSFIKNSQAYPHDALGSDATSVGLFQQQAWWGTVGSSDWKTDPVGTMKRLMDPTFQAQKFYNSLLQVPDWQNLPDGVAAQRVQVSATPQAYQGQKESEAQALYNQYKGSAKDVTLYDLGASAPAASSSSSSGTSTDSSGTCSGGAGTTSVPLDKSASYIVTAPFGDSIYHPTPHAGLDIACHMGDTVYAPISGTVTVAVDGNPSGYGDPAGHVDIRTPDGTVFWLWHLKSALVKPGQQVKGGQPVGACGSTGDSTGPHLHIQAQIENSTNAQIKALPIMQGINPIETGTGATDSVRDPALVLNILGVDICPPYVADRKTVPPGTPLPDSAKQCWPPNEWTK